MDRRLEKAYQFAIAIVNLTAPFASDGPFTLNLNGIQKESATEDWMRENYEIVSGVFYALSVLSAELQDTLDGIITEERLRT